MPRQNLVFGSEKQGDAVYSSVEWAMRLHIGPGVDFSNGANSAGHGGKWS